MTKKDLINAVSETSGVSKKDAAAVIGAVFAAITDSVANGDSVQIVGFGTFEARKRDARTGRNPHTGEAINISAATVPAFKAGKAFKDAVNKYIFPCKCKSAVRASFETFGRLMFYCLSLSSWE